MSKDNASTQEQLLSYLADYWVERELRLVETTQEIRQSLNNFNREACEHYDYALRLVQVYIRLWVYDPLSNTFGPNKFVGFKNMTIPKYQTAGELRDGGLDRRRFNGGRTHKAIRRVLGVDYKADRELWEVLEKWADELFKTSSVLEYREHPVWKFIRLE
jgi:hypothetical protein